MGNDDGDKPGAKAEGEAMYLPQMDPEQYKAVCDVMVGFELIIMILTNDRNAHALTALQTITGKLFERSAHCFQSGEKFKVGPAE
jgi:hypothetical protein